jgi:dTDP-4-dehydrorhamnose reductase
MKLLVFGSKGLIGTAVTRICKEDKIECIPFSREEVDITHYDGVRGVIKRSSPTVVINAAGIVGINPCEKDPVTAFKVNTEAVYNMAKACKEQEIQLVQLSTHNVFDGTKIGPYNVCDKPNPIQMYGITKYASEFAAKTCPNNLIFRFPTLFGDRDNGRAAFPNIVFDWLKNGKKFKISYDKLDSPSYSMDIVRKMIMLIKSYPNGSINPFHLANSGAVTYDTFTMYAAKILNIIPRVTLVAEKEFETMAPNALNTIMLSSSTLRPWTEALEEYLNERYVD